ncbi:MAG: FecR domain-containing protein [Bacteroidales bacterium]|nr:FecR domain-containing protein [Bacteroidales bacterium]
MNGNSTYYTDLITRYFSGETTEEELRLLSEWLKADPQNEQLFIQFKITWQLIERQKLNSSLNTDQEWTALQKKMGASVSEIPKGPKVITLNQKPAKSLASYWKIAASVTILLAASFLLYFNLTKLQDVVVAAQATNSVHVLPDGTVVSLHAGSEIKYASSFDSKKRKVELKGEAYFEVAHDISKPFVVASGDARVEVLGTKFNVISNTAAGTMEVVLTSGKVSAFFKRSPQKNVLLNPGEKAVLMVDQRLISKSTNTDPNYMAWKTKVLLFDNETLAQVLNTLQNVYQTPVTLADPALSECRVTASFDGQSLESVLQVIKETLDLQVKQNGKTIELSGKGCR